MFKNPLSFSNNSDPFITFDNDTGYYYFLASCQGQEIQISRSKKIDSLLVNNESKVIFTSDNQSIFGPFWAPEMYKIGDHWYIYTSCQERYNEKPFVERKQILILKSKTSNPFDGFEFGSKPDSGIFAIDPTIGFINNKQYICYSRVNEKGCQILEIREMIDPLTYSNNFAEIAEAKYDWEKVNGYDIYTINEGAFFVENQNRIFIIYSANGCWSDDYCLGTIEFIGNEVCDSNNWVKYKQPLFKKGNGVYGVGHASFFRSPDKSELWCAYHCLEKSNPSIEPANRFTCIQKLSFNEKGQPMMGQPLAFNKLYESPKGE